MFECTPEYLESLRAFTAGIETPDQFLHCLKVYGNGLTSRDEVQVQLKALSANAGVRTACESSRVSNCLEIFVLNNITFERKGVTTSMSIIPFRSYIRSSCLSLRLFSYRIHAYKNRVSGSKNAVSDPVYRVEMRYQSWHDRQENPLAALSNPSNEVAKILLHDLELQSVDTAVTGVKAEKATSLMFPGDPHPENYYHKGLAYQLREPPEKSLPGIALLTCHIMSEVPTTITRYLEAEMIMSL